MVKAADTQDLDQRAGLMAEAEAIAMGRGANLADEIAGLEDDDRVEAELEKLKSQVGENKEEDGNA